MFLALNHPKGSCGENTTISSLTENFPPALFELRASHSAPVTLTDNWDEQCGVKSCKNQPNASISIMSGRSDLCLPAGIALAGCLHTMPRSRVPPPSLLLLGGHVHVRGGERLFCLCGCLGGQGWGLVGWPGRSAAALRFHLKEVIWGRWGSYDTITERDLVLKRGWWEKIVVRGPRSNAVERGSDVTSSILPALTLQRSQLGTGTLCSHRLPCSQRWWSCYTSPETSTKVGRKHPPCTLQLHSSIISYSFLPKTCCCSRVIESVWRIVNLRNSSDPDPWCIDTEEGFCLLQNR